MKANHLKLLGQIYYTFFKLGCFSLGGGYAMIPLIEREVVEEKNWVDKERIIDIFAVAESMPGAIALNSSGFVGYSIDGIAGAIAALLGNLTPPLVIVLTLSVLFATFGSNPTVQAAFFGIRPAIIGLISYAAYKIGKTAIKDIICVAIMVLAFCGVLFLHIHPIVAIIFGATVGIILTSMENVMHIRNGKKHSIKGESK